MFAKKTVEAIHDVPDSNILEEFHETWSNAFRDTQSQTSERGAQIRKVDIGDTNIEGITVLEEAWESVLTNPNLQGLMMDFNETDAYAIVMGRLNNEPIRMKPEGRCFITSSKDEADEYTVHPKDEDQWYAGDDRVQENYFFDNQA